MNIHEFDNDQLWDISNDDYEGAHIVSEDTYRDGWYEYKTVTFVYDGVQYSFEYRSHTSPKVHESEITREATPTEVQPKAADPEEEAHFIWQQLMKMGKGHISKEEIKLITELQTKYLVEIGIIQ